MSATAAAILSTQGTKERKKNKGEVTCVLIQKTALGCNRGKSDYFCFLACITHLGQKGGGLI
jgi:hypothetical protein